MNEPSNVCTLYENRLSELRELTERLTFKDIATGPAPNYKQIAVERGHAYIIGLSRSDEYSVTFNFAAADTPYPEHVHGEWEYFIIISGHMDLKLHEPDPQTIPGDRFHVVKVPPNVLHSAYFPVQTTFLAITVPAEQYFPRNDE